MNKCKLKQTFALLAAMTMMSCAAACSGETEAVGEAGGDVPQIIVSETTLSDAETQQQAKDSVTEIGTAEEIKVINETDYAITEWDLEEFKTISCKGIDISVPCKLSNINEAFETKIIYADENDVYSDSVELYYNGEYVGNMLSESKKNYNTDTD